MNNIISDPVHVTELIVTRAPEPDWSGWENWLRSHLDIEREVMIEGLGEALGLVSHELRDRISALELKLAELTGAVDILRGTTTPPERDTASKLSAQTPSITKATSLPLPAAPIKRRKIQRAHRELRIGFVSPLPVRDSPSAVRMMAMRNTSISMSS